jgi:hypothetical protein
LPWSIANVDGSLAKTHKSKMLQIMEQNCLPVEHIPNDSARMIDAMAVLQSISGPPDTFCDLAQMVFQQTSLPFRLGSKLVDFVVGQYSGISIKRFERKARSRQGLLRIRITSPLQECPSRWKFMSVDANKIELVEFLALEWRTNTYAAQLNSRHLFVAHGTKYTRLTSCDSQSVEAVDVPSLECSHDEADTRLLLHAAHAEISGHQSVIIQSPDTDVAIIACALSYRFLCPLLLSNGD